METQTTIQQQFKIYPTNEQVNENSTSLVKLILRRPRLVHHMNLNYESIPYDCDPIQSKNLHIPLERLQLINSLYISFFEVDLENYRILQNISMKLKSLSLLQELSLQFYYSNWVFLEGVIHLANALGQMKLLKKLMLSLDSCQWVNDESLLFILRSLKKNKGLQSFELDLCSCLNVTEKSFKLLASIFKHAFKSLKELSLRLTALDFTKGYPLDFLAYGLIFLKDLQKLTINFSDLKIPKIPRGFIFSTFMSSIKHLPFLKILNLDLSSLDISATALKDLAKSLLFLTHLHTLSLSLRWITTFAGLEMEALAQCLQSIAPSLKSLTLEFRYSQTLNDQDLEKLSACLRTLTNLSEITLYCDSCPGIKEAGVASVTHSLESLSNLQNIILGFRGCRPIKSTYHESLKLKKNIINLTFNYEI